MNINEEGKYYALMVRKFRIHCLRNDYYRKPMAAATRVRAEQGLEIRSAGQVSYHLQYFSNEASV